MATNVFRRITQRGTESVFQEKLDLLPQKWDRFAQTIQSDAPDEEHVWMGNVPNPRQFLHQRNLVGISDFTYNVANQTYELSFKIDRTSMEDDRHGLGTTRIAQAAQVWGAFKDVQFAAMMNAGQTDTGYDGVSFFNDSHVVGSSTPDNKLYDSATTTTPTNPSVAEMKVFLRTLMLYLKGVQDDTGREGYNSAAMSEVVVMADQRYEVALTETIAAMLTGSGASNPYFQNLADIIINEYLGTTNEYIYIAALGDKTRMPIIYQERTPLEVVVLNSADHIAEHDGVSVLCRQRYRLAFGEFRRIAQLELV